MTVSSKQGVFAGRLKADFDAYLEQARNIDLVKEIINKNPAVFRKKEKSHQKVILNRLGWVKVIREIPDQLGRIDNLVRQVKESGVRHLFVLGMGGSSLCPEVFGKIFGHRGWLKSYTVIDTTAPSQLEAILKKTDLGKSFFIVSSKSGTTVETISQYRFFFKLMKELRPLKAGSYFAAITDEGSDLHRIGRRNRFREIFINSSDIGGRYSALSFFGLVPGAFTRVNLRELLNGAETLLTQLESSPNYNDALTLGVLTGVGAIRGHDKLSFRASSSVKPFIAWIEQLIAESTGKERKGIIPIEGEPEAGLVDCADDRIYVYYHMKGDRPLAGFPKEDDKTGPPRVAIELDDPHAMGAEMLKWEMATSVASSVLGVNPFDEPNVSESKKNTDAILKVKTGHRRIIPDPPLIDHEAFAINSVSDITGLNARKDLKPDEVLKRFVNGAKKGEYISLLCYTEISPEIEDRLIKLREVMGGENCVATLRGYGPRFLHSIGQLYKGGSQKGHFIVLEREYETDFTIPKLNINFSKLIKAQAEGDIKALRKRKRPLVRINLKKDPIAALDRILELAGAS